MSTIRVANIQHPDAASPSITISSDGTISAPSLGGRLEGSSYIFVAGDGTAAENGTALDDAYTAATALTPYGNALADGNRAWVVVAPGSYDTTLEMDTQFVNVVSLDGEMSVSLTGIDVSADNVLVRGIDVGTANFLIGDDLAGLVAEKCLGGDESFCYQSEASGTFTNCTGGSNSFGAGSGGVASGTFTNCTGGDNAFAYVGTASGTFTNCTAGNSSFGHSGIASGTFTNCTAGNSSFGTFGPASGTFTNCTSGQFSFGFFGAASGTFVNCTAGEDSFGGDGTASGTFTNCTSGEFSFGTFGTASGTFTNCTAGNSSFGNSGTLSGTVLYSRVTTGSFPTVSSGGIIRLSLNADFSEENQG